MRLLRGVAVAGREGRQALVVALCGLGCGFQQPVSIPDMFSFESDAPRGRVVTARGESVCALAGRYGVAASAVQRVNGRSTGPTLVPGTLVRIGSEPLRHQVAEGETLAGLARWYGLLVTDLARENRISDPDRIAAGSWLTVPPGARTGCPPPIFVARAPPQDAPQDGFAAQPASPAPQDPWAEFSPEARSAQAPRPPATASAPATKPTPARVPEPAIEPPVIAAQPPPPPVSLPSVPELDSAPDPDVAARPAATKPTPATEPEPPIEPKAAMEPAHETVPAAPATSPVVAAQPPSPAISWPSWPEMEPVPDLDPAPAAQPVPSVEPEVAVQPAPVTKPAPVVAARPARAVKPALSRQASKPDKEASSQEEARRMLERAQSRYYAADFGEALELANTSLRMLEPHQGREADRLRAQASWISGLVYTGLGQSQSAVASFRTALALDPSLADSAMISPKVRTLVDLAGVASVGDR